MCSIYGAFGQFDNDLLEAVRFMAGDRGRDGGGWRFYGLSADYGAVLGSWRAAPTTEAQHVAPQPYDGVVHNGTIANDRELGNPAGEVDSLIIPQVIDRRDVHTLAATLGLLKGSYALAIAGDDRVFLAANYKPVHYLKVGEAIYFASMERHLAAIAPFGVRPQRLKPYTVLDLLTGESAPIARPDGARAAKRALVICSGGLDSTTAAYMLRDQGYDVALLHFLYGCRAETREANIVRRIAASMGAPAAFLSLDYSPFTGGSPLLTPGGEIASGVAGAEFAHEWVPARNLVMLAHAVAYAEANGFGVVALGNNLEEAGAYPDNEEQFTELLDQVLDNAVHDGAEVRILSPVGTLMKHEIVAEGLRLGVPFEDTWSCYQGGEVHCGECGPCHMRRTAFARNGQVDPAMAHLQETV